MAYLWATYIVPETANVSLEMIDEVFKSPAGQEDLVVKRQVRSPFLTCHDSAFLLTAAVMSGGTRTWSARATG